MEAAQIIESTDVGGAVAAPSIIGRGNSIKANLDRTRAGEEAIKFINDGYFIIGREKGKSPMRFVIQPQYMEFFKSLLINGDQYHAVLKSRQAYFTTLVAVLSIYFACHAPNIRCVFNSYNQESVKDLMSDHHAYIVRNTPMFAGMVADYSQTHNIMRGRSSIAVLEDEINFGIFGGSADSVIKGTSMSVRGRNLSLVHYSEYPRFASRDPDRAREVKEGGLQAGDFGYHIFEGTAVGSGGEAGALYKEAQESEARYRQDGIKFRTAFRFWFYGWWQKLAAIESAEVAATLSEWKLDKEHKDYRMVTDEQLMSEFGKSPTDPQWAWHYSIWAGRKGRSWALMFEDYPTFAHEAFQVSDEERFMRKHLDYARNQAPPLIGHYPFLRGAPCHAFWDIGRQGALLVAQKDEGGWRIPLCLSEKDMKESDYLSALRNKNVEIYTHHLPWDGGAKSFGTAAMVDPKDADKSLERILKNRGLQNIQVHSKVTNKKADFMALSEQYFNRFRIDKDGCKPLLDSLDNVRKRRNKTTGDVDDVLVKDRFSHCYDTYELLVRWVDGEEGDIGHKHKEGEIYRASRRVRDPWQMMRI